MRTLTLALFISTFAIGALQVLANDAPAFSLPIKCTLNEDCFVQQYPDVDTGANARDYTCGSATYNGHKGTDFRIRSVHEAKKHVPVLAAADGRVTAIRDGVEDRFFDKASEARVKGRECGNGVLIDHGGGWVTQYCHMLKGSVRAKKGQRVARGATLGSVGYSGKAQFPHIHFEVRKDGKPIDPATGKALGTAACGAVDTDPLWQPDLANSLKYLRGVLIEIGFADRRVTTRDLEGGEIQGLSLSKTSPALVFYARFINLEAGDRLRLSMTGPDGIVAEHEIDPLERSKAQYVAFTGTKRRLPEWPKGQYEGVVELLRDGTVVSRTKTQVIIG